MQHIAEQTNLYCSKMKASEGIKTKHINTDSKEIEQFIGKLLFMDIFPLPQYRLIGALV